MNKDFSIKFFGGLGEIGGNQILVEADDTRIILDFGLNLSRYKEYFKRVFSEPKNINEMIVAGLIPNLEELESIDACFISHAHADHWKSIPALADNTKVYTNSCTKKLIDAASINSRNKINRYNHLRFEQFKTSEIVKIKNIEVEIFSVDHSIPGANAFLIHTSSGTLAYSGDFRLHGRYQPGTYFWEPSIESGEKIDAFICEGTNLGQILSVHTETDVEKYCNSYIEKCKRLVIIDISANDMERVRTLMNVSEKTKRKLLVTKRIARSLKALQDESDESIPIIDDDISFYEDYAQYAQTNPKKYLICTSFYGEKEVRELLPPPNSLYILSSSEPFEEEREIDFQRLKNWLNICGIPMYHIHSSGHASPLDIRHIIKKINPGKVFPIHSLYPDAFVKLVDNISNTIIPSKNRRYMV